MYINANASVGCMLENSSHFLFSLFLCFQVPAPPPRLTHPPRRWRGRSPTSSPPSLTRTTLHSELVFNIRIVLHRYSSRSRCSLFYLIPTGKFPDLCYSARRHNPSHPPMGVPWRRPFTLPPPTPPPLLDSAPCVLALVRTMPSFATHRWVAPVKSKVRGSRMWCGA